MNLGLTTSFIVGGILLISILTMNMSLTGSSVELTMTQITREKASSVQELISHDIQKMGYNKKNKTDSVFVEADSQKVSFLSNINNDNSIESVTWELTTNGLSQTENPNDFVLMRTVEHLDSGSIEQTPVRLGVTKFNIKYIEDHGLPISKHMSTPLSSSEMKKVKQLYITLELQSGEKVFQGPNDDGRYIRSIWEKRFSPRNLEENN